MLFSQEVLLTNKYALIKIFVMHETFSNSTQIRAETGATILSRGYYLAPGTHSQTERPLYLLISGENSIVVEKAKERLQEIINKAVRVTLLR